MSTTQPDPIISIGHNCEGRPLFLHSAGTLPDGRSFPSMYYSGRSSCSPFSNRDGSAARRFVDELARYGHAIVTDDRTWTPHRHENRVTGRTGHDDAEWCESRFQGSASMAAYYENGDPMGGRAIPLTRRNPWEARPND